MSDINEIAMNNGHDADDDIDTDADLGAYFDDQPVEAQPVPVAAAAPVKGGKLRAAWREADSGTKGALIGVVGLLGLVAVVTQCGGSSDAPATAAPPAAMAPAAAAPAAPVEPAKAPIVRLTVNRERNDPLWGLPDVHPLVLALAGDDAQRLANVVNTSNSDDPSKRDICDLWISLNEEGTEWELRRTAAPSDRRFARVFVSEPCAPLDPYRVTPAPTTAAPAPADQAAPATTSTLPPLPTTTAPPAPTTTAVPTTEYGYTVVPGDTLNSVSRATGRTVQAIADRNAIPADTPLVDGWVIAIPAVAQ